MSDKETSLFDPQPDQPRLMVSRWLRIMALIVANLLVLAGLAAYFKNQTISLIDVIGIIADGMGIITGLLGIWFFFLSERLNRTTAINLERTTSTVNDLREQMWEMIQKTFSTFVERENREQIEETRQAIEALKEDLGKQEGSLNPQILQTLNALSRRIDTIERQRDNVVSLKPLVERESPPEKELSESLIKGIILDNIDKFPLDARKIYATITREGVATGSGPETMADLVDKGYFVVADDTFKPGEKIKGWHKLNPGPGFLSLISMGIKKAEQQQANEAKSE